MLGERGGQVVEVQLGLAGAVICLDEEAAVADGGQDAVERGGHGGAAAQEGDGAGGAVRV